MREIEIGIEKWKERERERGRDKALTIAWRVKKFDQLCRIESVFKARGLRENIYRIEVSWVSGDVKGDKIHTGRGA